MQRKKEKRWQAPASGARRAARLAWSFAFVAAAEHGAHACGDDFGLVENRRRREVERAVEHARVAFLDEALVEGGEVARRMHDAAFDQARAEILAALLGTERALAFARAREGDAGDRVDDLLREAR